MPEVVISAWQKIWKMSADDFEKIEPTLLILKCMIIVRLILQIPVWIFISGLKVSGDLS